MNSAYHHSDKASHYTDINYARWRANSCYHVSSRL